jgi:DNA-binding beta-propeller fold protein YncE
MRGEIGRFGRVLGVAALPVLIWLSLAGSAAAAPGDVFVADEGSSPNGAVYKLGPAGGMPTVLANVPELHDASGMALDPSTGQLVVANFSSTLHTVDPVTGAVGVYATGPDGSALGDLVFAPDGQVYVSDDASDTGAVFRLDPATKTFTLVASGFIPGNQDRGAADIAASRTGKLYISDFTDSVYEVDPATGTGHLFARDAQLAGADGLDFSPDEKSLYVAGFCEPVLDCANSTDPPNQVARIDMATGAVSTLVTLSDAVAVSNRTDGSLLVTNTDLNALQIVPLSGSPVSNFSSANGPFSYPHDTVTVPDLCAGRIPTVVGTTGADTLVGSPHADVISTLGGKDKVKAGGDDDVVCGGPGKDKIFGQAGRDRLLGQAGKDTISGGKGKDRVLGGKGRDVLRCTPIDPRCK